MGIIDFHVGDYSPDVAGNHVFRFFFLGVQQHGIESCCFEVIDQGQIAFFFCFSLCKALTSAWSEMSNCCRNSGRVKVCLPCARRASRWYSKKKWGLRIIVLGQETGLKLSRFASVNLREVLQVYRETFLGL